MDDDGSPRVLVVDDEEGLRSLLTYRLNQEGFTVETAVDGEEALESLTTGEGFDVVVLDLAMPRMDGFELMRRLQNRGERPVVIVLSGRHSEEEQLRSYQLGAVDYVTKPFSPAVLATKVRQHLEA